MSTAPVPGMVAALPEELASLLPPSRRRRARRGWVPVRVDGRDAVAAITGDGAGPAATELGRLLDRVELSSLLVLGVAGGLSPELGVGQLVASREILDHRLAPAPPPDAGWLRRVSEGTATPPAVLVSADRLVCTPTAKAELLRRTGRRPAAVDLESAALAAAAAEHDVPFLVVRAISDPADEELPGLLARAQRRDGSVDRGRVVRGALVRPWHLPSLLHLSRRVRRCARQLQAAAGPLLARAPEGA